MKLPLPQRGQPFDLSLIYDIINTINQLWSEVASRVSAYASVDTSVGRKTVKGSDVKIVGGYKEIISDTTVVSGDTRAFQYDFANNFAYPPIVTATPVETSSNATNAGKNVTVVLTSITTTRVDGIVRFNTDGQVSVGLNLVAIGIPV